MRILPLLLPLVFLLQMGELQPGMTQPETPQKVLACVYIKSPAIEWTSPIFTLYDDGTVIFAKKNPFVHPEKLPQYATCKLNQFELQHERSLLEGLHELHLYYKATRATDKSEITIDSNLPERKASVTVYGPVNLKGVETVPKAFSMAYEEFSDFQHSDAVDWLPESIECAVKEVPERPTSTAWPADFPPLASRLSLNREQFRRFETLSEKEPFTSLGKWWFVQFRFPVPGETRPVF